MTKITATARASNSILQGLCENLLTASHTGGGDFGGYALSADLACNLSLQKVSNYDSYAFADRLYYADGMHHSIVHANGD